MVFRILTVSGDDLLCSVLVSGIEEYWPFLSRETRIGHYLPGLTDRRQMKAPYQC